MESPVCAENLSIDRKKMTEELFKGREFAIELQNLFQKRFGDHGLEKAAEELTEKILLSFTEALSLLNSGEISEVCQSPVATPVSSPFNDDRKTEDSGESRKILGLKDRRGGYKRRKISQTWTRETVTPIDDGHSWRKYGQKPILHAKFPRSYFRCTHKNDQGCQATKQVQRTEDDPPKYRTTYMGHHTCKDTLLVPKLLLDSSSRDSFVLNFQSNITSKQDLPFSSFQSIKQESKEQIQTDLTHIQSSSSSSDYFDWAELTSDVYTCTTSSQSLDGFMVGSKEFDDVFEFEELFN